MIFYYASWKTHDGHLPSIGERMPPNKDGMIINYAFLVGLGCSLGILVMALYAPPKEKGRLLDAGLIFLLGCLIGARLGYCALHSQYFSSHLGEVFQFWQGGLFWPGAAVGGLGIMLLLRRVWDLPWAAFLDLLAALLPPLAISAWLGCWQSGVAYGGVVPKDSWWGLMIVDENGVLLYRFPLQLIAALVMLFGSAFLELKNPFGNRTGIRGLVMLLNLTLILLAISFLRADPAPTWAGLRADSWCGIVLALGCMAGLLQFHKPDKDSAV
jgi:phosphatidylglycerol:prolipoprotein diacylglycerol transferase